ncbi:isochorismate synthase [Flavobacterium selenitireducens]|uniref:isochorismate synthase n=1 Tax=Flavobacterium selenitireducens TaxID=2722704 RepID=UPI00168AA379|nr:isochorismate synthase [Flavobacterium selenitireducens]MBD3581383.1 isochorismate synthase [Flavobacterium selenitireducens]
MELLQKAQLWLADGKPFVLFRKPGEQQATGIFQRGKISHGCNKWSDSGFVFAPFSGDESWILPDSDSDSQTEAFQPQFPALPAPSLQIDTNAKLKFEQLVGKGKQAIANGTFEKVVLSRTESVDVVNFDAIGTFGRLAASYPTAFVYLWFHPKTDIWMAATPETLLKASGNSFETMALAGTQKFEGEETVEWQKKEKEEQRLVKDFIWNSLEPIVSEIELTAPYTAKAGNLLHIRTDIKGELNDSQDLGQVISTLHPTPAVCGLPKADARKFILDNEGYKREYYAGFLGELNRSGKTDLYVNLRCMKVVASKAQLFMGCGITKDSDAEKEFFETVNKSLTMRKVL